MAQYQVEFHPAATKELSKLNSQIKLFIIESLEVFIDNYDDQYEIALLKSAKLKSLKGKWKGFYRLRLRSYRIIYEKIDNRLVIYIVRIAHRKEVY